jgi:hypothetical protein
MSVEIDGKTYYRTSEVCLKARISRATLFRWLKAGVLIRCRKDRRGWRLFNEDDLLRIRAEANKIEIKDNSVRNKSENVREFLVGGNKV